MNINPKLSSQHVYDYVIVGSGLSGLLMTAALSKATKNVLLIEAGDSFGGHTQKLQTAAGTSSNGLRFYPDTELSRKSLSFLSTLLGQQVNSETCENAPVTFESGALRPFLGFGSNTPAFYDEIAYFLSHQYLSLTPESYDWAQLLFEKSEADFISRSYVTKFIAEKSATNEADLKISHAVINGQKNISAHNFIYCGPLQSLAGLLPEAALSQKNRQKLSKAQFWTAVCLDLLHSTPVTDSTQLHILNGTAQDDSGACAGRFYPSAEGLQLSQWISFIDTESAEDTEQIATTLKKIKRQVKRAYPEALENLKSERILVAPSIGGNGDLKLSANQSLPNVSNFWIASGGLSAQKNLLGGLQQAELVCSALGFHPAAEAHPSTVVEVSL